MNIDERTSPRAVLTQENDETASKIPRKLPIILLAFFVVATLSLLGTTVYFAIQTNKLGAELESLQPTNYFASMILSSMDKSKDPCENFYEYACGGWTRKQVIPDYSLEVTKFTELQDDLMTKLKGLIERESEPDEPPSFAKVRDYYQACIDLDTANSLGARPLTDMLQSLGGWPVLGGNPGGNWKPFAFSLERLWAKLRAEFNVDVFISTDVAVNISNSGEYILELNLPELTVALEFQEKRQKRMSSLIPEKVSRDFGRNLLLLEDLEEERAAYLQYMIDIAVALGGNRLDVTTDMTNVLEFEKQLAQYAIAAVRDEDDHPLVKTIADLRLRYYGVDWENFFNLLMPSSVTPPVTLSDSVKVIYPSYVTSVTGSWLNSQDDRVIANYMIWHLVNRMVPYLGQEFLTIYQKYLSVLTKTSAPTPRWKNCVDQTNTVLPYATGRMYVDKYFCTDAQSKTEQIVGNLRQALGIMINDAQWMLSSDRSKARAKLNAMEVAVGYPDWLKTDTLDSKSADLVISHSYFSNGLNYRRRLAQTALGNLRLPVDKSLWLNSGPAVINAYYSPYDNGIIIPAAILQPPFYHPDLPWYSIYGAIGVVLGHEITHGFDSTGRFFDKDGNVGDWWSLTSENGFTSAAQCMVDQYSAFTVPENGKHVEGDQTEAENIADNGGLREAYKAYKAHAPSSQQQLSGLKDLTDDQIFFLSYSQVWCSVMTREGANIMVDTGKHSPGRFRVIGPLQNNEDFNSAFNCPASSYMNRYHKCKVW